MQTFEGIPDKLIKLFQDLNIFHGNQGSSKDSILIANNNRDILNSIGNALVDYTILDTESINPILYQFKYLIIAININSNADSNSYKQIYDYLSGKETSNTITLKQNFIDGNKLLQHNDEMIKYECNNIISKKIKTGEPITEEDYEKPVKEVHAYLGSEYA